MANFEPTLKEHHVHASGRAKNVCTSAVLQGFGIAADRYHYAECIDDVLRVLRVHGDNGRGFSVRSRRSYIPARVKTVAQLQRYLSENVVDCEAIGYYIGVPGHAMALHPDGRLAVDTARVSGPDNRELIHVHAVRYK